MSRIVLAVLLVHLAIPAVAKEVSIADYTSDFWTPIDCESVVLP